VPYPSRINFRGKHKVGARQPAGFVRPDRHAHFAPRQVNVGMVPLGFRNGADAVRKRQRLREIGKRELLLEVMLIDDAPVAAELFRQRRQLLPFQRRHAAAAGNAGLLRQGPPQLALGDPGRELPGRHAMAERFHTIDVDDRHIVRELRLQQGIVVDIDQRDRQRQMMQHRGRAHGRFRGIAQRTIVAHVERHLMSHRVNSLAFEDT
jgi:hypothetical protein